MNEKGKDFIFCKNPYAFSRPSWSIAHGHSVCTLSVPVSTPALDLHSHTQWYCLLLLGQRVGGVHVLKYILFIPFEILTYHYPQPWICPFTMN